MRYQEHSGTVLSMRSHSLLLDRTRTRTMNQQAVKVLVAEDDTEIRTALERILRYEGYEPVTVNDGAAALEANNMASYDKSACRGSSNSTRS